MTWRRLVERAARAARPMSTFCCLTLVSWAVAETTFADDASLGADAGLEASTAADAARPPQNAGDAAAHGSTLVAEAPAAAAVSPEESLDRQPAAEVTVRARSRADKRRESAESVYVLELARAQRTSADMGQVLARTQGVSVRRTGALGSDARLALNGLTDEQVRIYVDGVPLELGGYPFGIANVPLELVARVEIHRGVVPLRLGGDASGGAIELVSHEPARGTHGTASYQVGSFDTHRLVGSARHLHAPSGLFLRAEGSYDAAENDYPITVLLEDARGGRRPRRVRRNNDAYRAGFASIEAGYVRRPWAKRLTLRGYFGDLHKEIPSDPLMQVPYGEVQTSRRAGGALLRFESQPLRGFSLQTTLSYSDRRNVLEDVATCAYDWLGNCVFDRSPARGERPGRPYDSPPDLQHVRTQTALARVVLHYRLGELQELRLAAVPTYVRRTGEDRAIRPPDVDPLAGQRELFTLVSGLEHALSALDGRLENLLFVKHYLLSSHAEDILPSSTLGRFDRRHRRAGAGDGLRFRFAESFFAKLAYEWTTRLPSPDQLFGDGALLSKNLTLKPETAHNFNLEGVLRFETASAGEFRAHAAGFARLLSDLLVPLVRADALQVDNVDRARSIGVEGSAAWTSPNSWFELEANATYQDYRNRSQRGEYAPWSGDRIPYRPYLFANGVATLFARELLARPDELSFSFRTSYVREYLLGWESANPGGARLSVPHQLVYGLSATLLLVRGSRTISSSIEVHNLTDRRIYDFYGAQLPGRAFAAKLTLGV